MGFLDDVGNLMKSAENVEDALRDIDGTHRSFIRDNDIDIDI